MHHDTYTIRDLLGRVSELLRRNIQKHDQREDLQV
jgi:hypothetical protein